MSNRNRRKNERGVALIAAIGFTVLVLALGLAVVSMTTREQMDATASGSDIQLRNIAEAGVDRAFVKLNEDPNWRCTGSPAEFTNAPVTETFDGKTRTLGTFTVEPIQSLGADYIQVTAHAYIPNASDSHRLEKTIRVVAYQKWGMPFSAAVFGKVGIAQQNGDTDSWNSALGSYYGQTPGTEGDVRTDSTDPGAITLQNNGYIRGKVIYGPGTDISKSTLSRSNIIDGDSNEANDILSAPASAVMPPAVLPSNAVDIRTINGGSGVISGNLNIPAGTWVCDSVRIQGNKKVTTSGPVTLYVRGSCDIQGNGIVNGGITTGGIARPQDLMIYGLPGCTSVSIGGNGAFTGVMYAPNAEIHINGNGGIWGAVVGNHVTFSGNNGSLHYDVALKGVAGTVVGFRAKHWQEG